MSMHAGSPHTGLNKFVVGSQVRLGVDTQNFQTGTYVNWTLSNGTAAPAVNTAYTPLQFSVNLQDQVAPTFLTGPTFMPLPVSLSLCVFKKLLEPC